MVSGIPLIQGGREDQETAQQMITAVIICAIVIVVAQPVVMWLTGFNEKTYRTSDEGDKTYWVKDENLDEVQDGMSTDEIEEYALPAGFSNIFGKIIQVLRGIAAFAMVVALIWGGIKLQAERDVAPPGVRARLASE